MQMHAMRPDRPSFYVRVVLTCIQRLQRKCYACWVLWHGCVLHRLRLGLHLWIGHHKHVLVTTLAAAAVITLAAALAAAALAAFLIRWWCNVAKHPGCPERLVQQLDERDPDAWPHFRLVGERRH